MLTVPIIVLVILGILILLVIIFVLPPSISGKIAGIGVAIGLILTGIGLWLSADTESRRTREQDVDKSNEYAMNIYKTFIQTPSLTPMYTQIYGNSIPPNEHAMYSIMMQEVEAIIAISETIPISKSWENTIRRWISPPSFLIYWPQNKDQYEYETQNYIDFLLRKNAQEKFS